MGYLKSICYEFKNTYTRDEQIITILFGSLFLPYQITVVCFLGGFLYLCFKESIIEVIKSVKGSIVILLFAVYLMSTSIFYSNWIGLLLSIGLGVVFVCVLHYRCFIHRALFEKLLNFAVVLSLVGVLYAVFEHLHYMSLVEGMGFFDIQNKPNLRVHTFFMNANYYAMMILFVENICVYKFFVSEKIKIKAFYTIAGVLNLFALFLTGSRTAWLCLAISVLVMLIVNCWYKTFASLVGVIVAALGTLSLKPGLIPRLASQGLDVARRTQIWNTAKLMIEDSFLFGRGPLAYYNEYASYTQEYISTYGLASFEEYKLGIASQHSHTMFLECFVSFGFIGTIMLCYYLGTQLKMLCVFIYRKIELAYCSLLVGILVSVLTSCVIDFPILWIQTGTFMLFILGSVDMIRKEMK